MVGGWEEFTFEDDRTFQVEVLCPGLRVWVGAKWGTRPFGFLRPPSVLFHPHEEARGQNGRSGSFSRCFHRIGRARSIWQVNAGGEARGKAGEGRSEGEVTEVSRCAPFLNGA